MPLRHQGGEFQFFRFARKDQLKLIVRCPQPYRFHRRYKVPEKLAGNMHICRLIDPVGGSPALDAKIQRPGDERQDEPRKRDRNQHFRQSETALRGDITM
jgi:hypothetical protein